MYPLICRLAGTRRDILRDVLFARVFFLFTYYFRGGAGGRANVLIRATGKIRISISRDLFTHCLFIYLLFTLRANCRNDFSNRNSRRRRQCTYKPITAPNSSYSPAGYTFLCY